MLTIAILWLCASVLALPLFGLSGAGEDDEASAGPTWPPELPPRGAAEASAVVGTTA